MKTRMHRVLYAVILGILMPLTGMAQESSFYEGIPDAWREQYFGAKFADKHRASALADPDRDGANNYLEYITGTDPTERRSFDRSPVWVGTLAGSELA